MFRHLMWASAAGLVVLTSCGKPEPAIQAPASTPPEVVAERPLDPFATPPPSPFEVPEPDPDRVAVVHFGFDRHNISDSQVPTVNDLAKVIQGNRIWVRLVGHADNRGPAPYNRVLGLRRAQAVRDYLIRQGVEDWRIESVESAGETQPVDGHPKNRRVEVWVAK